MKNQKLAFGIQTTPFAVDIGEKLGERTFALDGKTWWYRVLSEKPVALGFSACCSHNGTVYGNYNPGVVGGVALAANLDDQQSASIDALLKNEPAKFNLNYAKFLENFMIEVDDESNGLTQDERKMLKNHNSGEPVHPIVKLVKETGADGKTRLMPKDLLIHAPFTMAAYDGNENYNENFKNHFIYKVAKIANKVLAKMIDKDIMNVIQPKVQVQEKVDVANANALQTIGQTVVDEINACYERKPGDEKKTKLKRISTIVYQTLEKESK
jgi:hypothetical protein